MRNICLSSTVKYNVSKSRTHQKILLTYHILIEVIPIVAPIIIWRIRRVFAESDSKSSIKLTMVITHQNHKINPSL